MITSGTRVALNAETTSGLLELLGDQAATPLPTAPGVTTVGERSRWRRRRD